MIYRLILFAAMIAMMPLATEARTGAARSPIAGSTNMTFSAVHGTQIEYLAPDGTNDLWYPGNTTIVRGHWRIGTAVSGAGRTICFQYQANSFNPATGSAGAQWECEPLAIYQSRMVDVASGDVFGLDRRTEVPFDLPPDRTTISALRRNH